MNNQINITKLNLQGELGIIIDNKRKSNYEDILDLFDMLVMNDRESSSSLYIIQDLLVTPSNNPNEYDLVKYKFIKFITVNDSNIALSEKLYEMLKELIVDLSL